MLNFLNNLYGTKVTEEEYILYAISEAEREGYDLSCIKGKGYNKDQVMVLIDSLKRGTDISRFKDPRYSSSIMVKLRCFVEHNETIPDCVNPELSDEQINFILSFGNMGVDLTPVAKPGISEEEMLEYYNAENRKAIMARLGIVR